MKQILIPKTGKSHVLKLIEIQEPVPKSGELLIDVKASGINFADIMARKGLYPDAPSLPGVVGYEISGIVRSVGENGNSSMIGKEVIALTHFGGYSSVVSVPENQVFLKPDALDFVHSAALPVNYLTAYQLLIVMGSLKNGESLLIHNAGGGVGLAAIDIAKKTGAFIYGTASSSKHKFLKERGVDKLIDYRKEDWYDIILFLTEEKGVDLIIDPLGGQSWRKSYKALRSTGRLGMFGISKATECKFGGPLRLLKGIFGMPFFNPISLMNMNKGAFGVNLGQLWHEVNKVRTWMEILLKGVQEGWVNPYVDKTFTFSEVSKAHEYIEDRKNIGKIVLIPD